jgi:hypothetical protein
MRAVALIAFLVASVRAALANASIRVITNTAEGPRIWCGNSVLEKETERVVMGFSLER